MKLNGDEIRSDRVIGHARITVKIPVPFGLHQCDIACGMPNALVQLQVHLTMRAQRAMQKCLSAATFVRRRREQACCRARIT
jgi:hypothetical protein